MEDRRRRRFTPGSGREDCSGRRPRSRKSSPMKLAPMVCSRRLERRRTLQASRRVAERGASAVSELFIDHQKAPIAPVRRSRVCRSDRSQVPTSCVKQGNAASAFSRSSPAKSSFRLERLKRTSRRKLPSRMPQYPSAEGPCAVTRCAAEPCGSLRRSAVFPNALVSTR